MPVSWTGIADRNLRFPQEPLPSWKGFLLPGLDHQAADGSGLSLYDNLSHTDTDVKTSPADDRKSYKYLSPELLFHTPGYTPVPFLSYTVRQKSVPRSVLQPLSISG